MLTLGSVVSVVSCRQVLERVEAGTGPGEEALAQALAGLEAQRLMTLEAPECLPPSCAYRLPASAGAGGRGPAGVSRRPLVFNSPHVPPVLSY